MPNTDHDNTPVALATPADMSGLQNQTEKLKKEGERLGETVSLKLQGPPAVIAIKRKLTVGELTNKFMHHPPVKDQAARYEQIRAILLEATIKCVDLSTVSAEQTRAVNSMQEALFLFNASIALYPTE